MAAGLGFKTFTTGEVLTAADTNGYLMQGVLVFANAAARDAAITSPQEGQACYLKDTNQVLTYSGSAWVAVGGGSPLTTKGDVYGFSTVDARIPIGANNTVLTADSTQALGLKWAAVSGGSLTQLGSTTTLSGASTTVSFTATGYKNLYVQIDSVDGNGATKLDVEPNATNNLVDVVSQRAISGTYLGESAFDSFIRLIRDQIDGSDTLNAFSILIYDVASTTAYKTFTAVSGYKDDSLRRSIETMGGIIKTTSAISSLKFQGSGSGYSAGNVKVYGVN